MTKDREIEDGLIGKLTELKYTTRPDFGARRHWAEAGVPIPRPASAAACVSHAGIALGICRKIMSYFVQFKGTISECLKEEQRKLFNYPYLPENLGRPEQDRLPRPPYNSKMQ